MVNYNPLRNDIAELCDQLADRIELIRTISEAPRVHVIGHSLGGILLRWYVQELPNELATDEARPPSHEDLLTRELAHAPL